MRVFISEVNFKIFDIAQKFAQFSKFYWYNFYSDQKEQFLRTVQWITKFSQLLFFIYSNSALSFIKMSMTASCYNKKSNKKSDVNEDINGTYLCVYLFQ